MDLRTDVKSRWRDQHLSSSSSEAAWLQSRWQEVSERERRAQLHNRKLLQDFQRAQDTLTDLVARTEAMNTIRVEYERYLEKNFPRWQQKLKDKRLSEQRKRIEEHLKACIQQMEEDQEIGEGNKSSIRASSASSISPDLSHPPVSHPIPHTSEHKDKRREVHVRKPRNTLSQQDNKQDLQRDIQNDPQPFYIPFTWLTHQPSVTEPQHSNISKQTKTFQNIQQALNSSFPLPGDPPYGPVPVVQQEQPFSGHLSQHPKDLAGGVQFAPAGFPWTGLPVNPLVWKMLGMSDADAKGMQYSKEAERGKRRKSSSSSQVEKHQAQSQGKNVKGSDQSSERDTNSVRLSNGHGDSSEDSALSSEAVNILSSGMQRMKKERRRVTQTHKSSGGKEGVSQHSSSMSDSHCNTNYEKDKISQSSPMRKASFKTGKRSKAEVKNNTAGVESPKQLKEESELEGNSIKDRHTNGSNTVEEEEQKRGIKKIDKLEEKHHKDQEERVSEGGEGCVSEDGESKRGEEEEGADVGDEEQNEEIGSEGLYGKRNGKGASDEQEADGGMNDKACQRRNASEGGFVSEKEGERKGGEGGAEEEEDGGGEEDEEEEEEEEEVGDVEEKDEEEEEGAEEVSLEVRAPRRGSKEGDESDEAGNDSEVAVSDSRRNGHDSLRELYKDEETEDEELYDQEIEDDVEEEDDDDDDDVVVGKAYPWSHGQAYNHAKYQDDDDDDDVEGLLAPQSNVQQHQSDEEKELLKPKDSQSDSEEDGSHRKPLSAPVKDEPAGSDDEFDHFYD